MKKEKISLRKTKPSDIDIFYDFTKKLFKHENKFTNTIKKDKTYYTKKKIEEILKAKNTFILIAEIDKKPVGLGYAKIRENEKWNKHKERGTINILYVDKKYRGRKIGNKLYNEIIKWFKDKKMKDIRLLVYKENKEALDVYKKKGFKEHLIEMVLK